LIRRLLVEQAAGQWRRYAFAFGLMGIAAASTAFGAYLVGGKRSRLGFGEHGTAI
jgi:hypothetical protein